MSKECFKFVTLNLSGVEQIIPMRGKDFADAEWKVRKLAHVKSIVSHHKLKGHTEFMALKESLRGVSEPARSTDAAVEIGVIRQPTRPTIGKAVSGSKLNLPVPT